MGNLVDLQGRVKIVTFLTHKNIRLAGVALAALLALSGCGNNNDTDYHSTESTPAITTEPVTEPPASVSDTPTAEDIALAESIIVTGPEGNEPEIEFNAPINVSATTTRFISDGTGAPIHEGQMVTVNGVQWRADTGEKVASTWDTGYPESFVLGSPASGSFDALLQGGHIGARVLVLSPTPEGFTYITILEVDSVTELRATGEAQPDAANTTGIGVTLAANGEPSVDIPAGFVPSDELVVHTLIEGTGPVVNADDTVMIQYTGWLLNGEIFDSSWTHGEPATFPLGDLIDGWIEGLAGQRVGSQVLLIIPPELGYGPNDVGPIPGNSTLVFVIDILRAG